MWTDKENTAYEKNLAEGKILANKTGHRWAKSLKKKMKPDAEEERPYLKGIDHLYVNLVLEPLIASTDFGYEELGYGLKKIIDLYIGRKCAKIIPLLLEVAKRLHEKGCTSKKTAHEGGGADHWYWVEEYGGGENLYYGKRISMRWDTQTYSYYITLSLNICEEWKLYVAEYKYGATPGTAKESWQKEPGYVLEYTSFGKQILKEPQYQIDDCEVENAWLYLEKINRWMAIINTVCTSLNFDLYGLAFNPDKAAARKREKRNIKQKV